MCRFQPKKYYIEVECVSTGLEPHKRPKSDKLFTIIILFLIQHELNWYSFLIKGDRFKIKTTLLMLQMFLKMLHNH